MTVRESSVPHYLLYGSRASYYTMKVFAYLRYKGIHFDLVKVTDQIAEDIIKPFTGGWRVVPIIYGPDSGYVQDSSLILDKLESLHPQRSILPTGLKQRVVAALFELLGDDWLVFPAMHYRWNFKRHNLPYILKTFGQNRTPHWPSALRWLGGIRTAQRFAPVAREMLGVNRKNIKSLERWSQAFVNQLNEHFAEHDYLLGGRACHGDFALFGPLKAHLASDPYPRTHLLKQKFHLFDWLHRMEQTPRDTGKWLPNDEIPNSLIPILQWQFQDQISYVHEVMSMTSQWLAEHPDTSDFPRFIGKAPYKIDGACGQRMCAPYTQWMYQRVSGPIEQVTASENAALTQWLAQHQLQHDLCPPDYRVYFYHSRVWRREQGASE